LLLARVPDGYCTGCHADLNKNYTGKTSYYPKISDFAGHPPFGQSGTGKLTDPGTIRFNHSAHLHLPDTVMTTLGEGPLECSSCHQTDAAGRTMKPIAYEQHCARCHALTVHVVGKFPDARAQKAVEAFSVEPAP